MSKLTNAISENPVCSPRLVALRNGERAARRVAKARYVGVSP
ncbi:hypothetical protein [Rhizobium daejeonense]|nr:hypothetical protein [Rhizobium daejeonense]